MRRISLQHLLALTLIALGIGATADFLEPLYARSMSVSPALIALPIGVLLFIPGHSVPNVIQWVMRISTVAVLAGAAAFATAVAVNAFPMSTEFEALARSPWFWLQAGISAVSLALVLWLGGELVGRLAADSAAGGRHQLSAEL